MGVTMKLTKDDFHKWDDKYPNELMIDSDKPKELADQILKNQEIANHIEEIGEHNAEIVDRKYLKQLQEDAEKFRMVESLFAELEIPLPYDLWLANSLKNKEIVERLRDFKKNINAEILDKNKIFFCGEYSCQDTVNEHLHKILGEGK